MIYHFVGYVCAKYANMLYLLFQFIAYITTHTFTISGHANIVFIYIEPNINRTYEMYKLKSLI